MIMEFEENFLDIIVSECTSNTLFDEYVNYEQIVSESLILSEAQQIKLDILREFSIKDIGNKIAGAFKAIKTFISNLIFKLGVFIKNIGKDEIFKNVGKAISELSPEERKEIIKFEKYVTVATAEQDNIIKNVDLCINYVMKVLKSKNKDEDITFSELDDKFGISDVEDLIIPTGIELDTKDVSGTKIEAYKNYIWCSKILDEQHNKFTKLSKKISNQLNQLEKIANNLDTDEEHSAKEAVKIVRKLLLPAMKSNAQWLKEYVSMIAKETKQVLNDAIGLIKGDKSKIKDAELDLDTKDSTNESYDPWAGLEESYDPWADLY